MERFAGSALTVGDKIRVRFRMVNVQWANTVADPSYTNPWEFMYTGSLTGNVDIDELLRQLANKPRLGLWISGRVCEAECVNWPMGEASGWLADRLDGEQHYTDLIFEYTVQAGDLALPVQLANERGTGPAVGEEKYYLKCNGLDTLWKMVDQRTHSVTNDFAFGPQNLYDDPDFAGEDLTKWRRVNTPDVENRDLDLSGAGVYVQAIDFDTTYFKESEGLWRSIAQGATTSDPGTPTIAIAGGAARPMDLYLWTESNTVAEVVAGGQVESVEEYQFGDGVTRKVGKVHITTGNESVPFSIKATGDVGASTKVFLSATPTNIYNAANDLVTNFITRTVQVGEPLPPGISVTVNGKAKDTVTANADYATALVGVNVTLSEAWDGSGDLTIPLKVSVKEKPDLNARDYVGMSLSSVDDNMAWDAELTIPSGQTSATLSLWMYANRGTLDTENNGLLVEVDTNAMDTAARAFFTGKILPATVVVNRSTPEITAELSAITAEANTPQEVTINVRDAYGEMRDPCRYTVYWSNSGNDSAAYYTKITNLTATAAGDITFSVTYTAKGDYTSKFYIVNEDGKASAKHDAVVSVTAQKMIEAILVGRKFPENGNEEQAVATLSFGEEGFKMPNAEPFGYVFLVPRDANSSSLVECADFGDDWKKGLQVFSGDQTTEPITMTLLDGIKGNTTVEYDIMVRTEQNWDDGDVVSMWNSRGLVFAITNVAPAVTQVMMGGLEVNPGDVAEASLGVSKTFSAFTDEPSDLDLYADAEDYADRDRAFETRWEFKLGNNPPVVTNIYGPPDRVFPYTFKQAGEWQVKVKMRDKDMDHARNQWGPDFTFKVNVASKPAVTLAPFNGLNTYSEGNSGPQYGKLKLGLTMVPAEGITVHLNVTRVAADADYPLPRLDTYDVDFGGTSGRTTEAEICFDWLDGTPLGANRGFNITATVTNTTENSDGVAWKDLYTPATLRVLITNEKPQIENPGAITNIVEVGRPTQIQYTVKDVPADMTAGLTLTWLTGEGREPIVETVSEPGGEGSQYVSHTGMSPTFAFSTPGLKRVVLQVVDKDTREVTQAEWWFQVPTSKSLIIYPRQPDQISGRSGHVSAFSGFYTGAPGLGDGRVWTVDGAAVEFQNFVHQYTFDPKTPSANVYARGYKVGEVDDGALLPGPDIVIDAGGNHYNSGSYSSYYTSRELSGLDSYFYCWILNSKGEGGGNYAGSLLNSTFLPAVEAKGQHVSDGHSLVPLAEYEEELESYEPTVLEAIFSKELLQSDNVGDINQDGIPDVFAVDWTYDGGKLFEFASGDTGAGGGAGGNDAQASALDVKSKLFAFNGDGDYLPADSMTGGNILNTADTWTTIGQPFTAYQEIRGFNSNLNYRTSNDGLNYRVRGKWVSDPAFSPAESNAIVYVNKQRGIYTFTWPVDITNAEHVANWNRGLNLDLCWIPENRTDPTMDDTDGDGFPDGFEYYFWYMAQVGWIDDKGEWKRLEGEKFRLENIAKGVPISADDIVAAFNPTAKAGEPSDNAIFKRDTDGDGLSDLEELAAGTNPIHWDSDGDGMSDLWEILRGLDPLKKDAGTNADGDFMALVDLKEDFAILTFTTNKVTEFWAVPNNGHGFVDAKTSVILEAATGTVFGVKVYRYGNDSSPWTPVNHPKLVKNWAGDKPVPEVDKMDKLDLAAVLKANGFEEEEGDEEDDSEEEDDPEEEGGESARYAALKENVVAITNQHIRLVHDQVYAQYGYDPRTAWNKNKEGYVADRWNVTKSSAKYAGETGKAINTAPFTALHEYLLLKYRYSTRPLHEKVNPSDDTDKTYSVAKDKANIKSGKMTMADVLNLGTTNPNSPYEDKTYGNLGGSASGSSGGSDEGEGTKESAAGGPTTYSSTNHGADTDEDGVPDGWELYVGRNPNSGGGSDLEDKDGDKLGLVAEYAGTDSCNAYEFATNGVGAATIYANHTGNAKGWFNKFFPTDPWNGDTDGDGIEDGDEGNTWKAYFRYGNVGSKDALMHTYTFIYGPNDDKPEKDDGTICIRGGGLNPCTVDTDGDLLPDPWEMEFAGVVFNAEGRPDKINLKEGIIRLIRRSDNLANGATANQPYITAGMDGTHGARMESAVQTGDAYASVRYTDPFTGTKRNYDFDHDGLQNFQEYLVQSLRHLRYDDKDTPLMGQWMPDGTPRSRQFFAFVPMNIMDGETFYAKCKSAGFPATGAWKFNEIGYFARPAHAWDLVAQNTYSAMMVNYDACGYRVMLRPKGANGYCSTDPRMFDTDGDGLDDYYEIFHGLNPLLGSIGDPAEGLIANDVIAQAYLGAIGWCANAWTAGEQFGEGNSPYDAMKYPWMMGTPEADADGDGLINAEEGIYPNLSTPRPSHTDPTPLWMTDSTSPGKASYTVQYYQMDPDAMVPDFAKPGVYPWEWNSSDGSINSKGQYWLFAFEENEGYDTDHDGLSDISERTTTATVASDPLNFTDPDRRQALWFPGVNSAAVSYNSTFCREVDFDYSFLKRFTVEAWVCPEDVAREQVIIERVINCTPTTLSNNVTKIRANFRIGLTAEGHFFGQFDTADAIESGSGDSSPKVVSVFPQEAGKWAHVALTYDGAVMTLYVDGKEAGSFQTTLAPANGILVLEQDAVPNTDFPVLPKSGYKVQPSAVVLGARAAGAGAFVLSDKTTWAADFNTNQCYAGYVDEVRVWDDVRTRDQIATWKEARLSFADVKALRDEAYNVWRRNGTHNDNDGYPNMPAELVIHYNFQTLYGAVDAVDVASEPVGFTKNVVDNVRVDGGLVPGGLWCGWWSALRNTVGSTVYDNYHLVPWIPNTCAHLPFMDGSTPDSQYWSKYFGGVAYASEVLPELDLTSSATEQAILFANSANPYPYYCYIGDRTYHGNALAMLADLDNACLEKYNLWRFEARSGLVGCSDLVPLGDAFAKRVAEMWDGQGAATAWELTRRDGDADGIPTWWETVAMQNYGAAEGFTWSSLVVRDGVEMTAREAYLRDIAAGMLPGGVIDDAYRMKADTNSNGLPDWWENLYGVDSASEDSDRDGLSNFAEYLIGEGFANLTDPAFPSVKPSLPHSMSHTPGTWFGQIVPDYFLRVGKLYLGEMFTDHDMMEDAWEDQFSVDKISRAKWDALSDGDDDGWSNFAECRANTDPTSQSVNAIDDFTVPQYPIPTVTATIVYNGEETLRYPIVVQAFSKKFGAKGIPDAIWTVGSGESSTKYLGLNLNSVWRSTLGPGAVSPGKLKVSFKDPNYEYGSATNRSYGTLATAEWMVWLSDKIRAGSSDVGDIVTDDNDETGEIVGTINYVTGAIEIDFSKLQYPVIWHSSDKNGNSSAATEKLIHLATSYVKVEWESSVPTGKSRITLSLADSLPDSDSHRSRGHLFEGSNMFVAFLDSVNADGKWTPGEPYGVVANVDVGWNGTSCEIELKKTTPQIVRIDLASAIQAGDFATANGQTDRGIENADDKGYLGNVENSHPSTNLTATASSRTKVRIVRKLINSSDDYGAVVFERDFDLSVHPTLTEADLLGNGVYDLDWGTLTRAYTGTPTTLASATYRIVIGDGEAGEYEQFCDSNLALNFCNRFEASAKQTPTVPDPNLAEIVYAGRPTFRWSHPNSIGKAYPAFRLRIYTAASKSDSSMVYDSGVQQAPPRNSAGVYEWTAPVYCGMVTAKGKVFNTTNNYYWAVSMLDAKFTDFSTSETATPFRLSCTGDINDGSGYGSIKVAVKYFGPLADNVSTSASTKENLIHVQAFTTPDFTGVPAGEAYVTNAANIASASDVSVNAVIRGVPSGTYYVRAFLDTNGNFKKDAWESWGYGCYVGAIDAPYANVSRSGVKVSASDFPYTPRGYVVAAGGGVPEATVYIEDVDRDFDGFPDVCEMQNGENSLSARSPISGNTFFATVNPNLQANLSAYALGPAISGSTAQLGFSLMSTLMNGSDGAATMAALLSDDSGSAEGSMAVAIKSFSVENGLTLEVVSATAAASDLVVFKDEAEVTLALACSATPDFSDAVEVDVKTITIRANDTTDDIVVTAGELATARAKVPEARFFKAVIKKQ